jgi:hypothetical protein
VSLLADIYVSRDDEDAVRYDSEPASFKDREQYTSFTDLELSTLWAIIAGIEWQEGLLDRFRPSVLLKDDGRRTIHRLPSEMVVELARLKSEQIPTVTTEWAATDELACEPANAQPIVEALVRLALRASETGWNIYLWNCV